MGSVEGNNIVVAKIAGKIYAVSGSCPHYGLPLAAGMLDGYSLICPFHSASFDITTGEQLSPPALDSL